MISENLFFLRFGQNQVFKSLGMIWRPESASADKKNREPPGDPPGPPGKNLIFLKNLIFPKIDQNHVFIMFLDDLEAGIGISIKKA